MVYGPINVVNKCQRSGSVGRERVSKSKFVLFSVKIGVGRFSKSGNNNIDVNKRETIVVVYTYTDNQSKIA